MSSRIRNEPSDAGRHHTVAGPRREQGAILITSLIFLGAATATVTALHLAGSPTHEQDLRLLHGDRAHYLAQGSLSGVNSDDIPNQRSSGRLCIDNAGGAVYVIDGEACDPEDARLASAPYSYRGPPPPPQFGNEDWRHREPGDDVGSGFHYKGDTDMEVRDGDDEEGITHRDEKMEDVVISSEGDVDIDPTGNDHGINNVWIETADDKDASIELGNNSYITNAVLVTGGDVTIDLGGQSGHVAHVQIYAGGDVTINLGNDSVLCDVGVYKGASIDLDIHHKTRVERFFVGVDDPDLSPFSEDFSEGEDYFLEYDPALEVDPDCN